MLVLLIKGGMKGSKFGKQSFIIIEHSLIFVVALLGGNKKHLLVKSLSETAGFDD